jgi:very-short-patch-repair endonuclease
MGKVFNKKEQTAKRKVLLKNMTKAETLLWIEIKNKKLKDCKFRRQFRIEKYVIDNYSPEIKLAIEVDSATHYTDEEIKYDKKRQTEIENMGVVFLRFTNEEVYEGMSFVLEKISLKIDELRNNLKTPSP